MKLIDFAAGMVPIKHYRTNVVTASLDRLDLLRPGTGLLVRLRQLITERIDLNYLQCKALYGNADG